MACCNDICVTFAEDDGTDKGQCSPPSLSRPCGVAPLYVNDTAFTATDICPEGALGGTLSYTVAIGDIGSNVSVADANVLAEAAAEAGVAALRAASPCYYDSIEQTATDICPEGTTGETVSVTIPAGTYSSVVSQEDADAQALAAAEAQVAALRAASPCVVDPNPLRDPASLWGWGYNGRGPIGNGNTIDQYSPDLVGETIGLDWIFITGDEQSTIGVKADGTLWAWGSNWYGQLGQGTQSIFPNTAFNSYEPIQIGSDTDWFMAAANEGSFMAIKSNGTLWSWGFNWIGVLGHGDAVDRLSPTQVGTDTDWEFISGSKTAFVYAALKTNGTIWMVGQNNVWQCGQASNAVNHDVFIQEQSLSTDWTNVAATQSHVWAVKSDGTLWTWGGFGGLANQVTQMGSDTDWVKVKGNDNYAIAQKTDGTIWGWGLNSSGQLGLGDLVYRASFEQIGVDTWLDFDCGVAHTLGVKTDGSFWGWGDNTYGQLGLGYSTGPEMNMLELGSDGFWVYAAANVLTSFGFRSVTGVPPPPQGSTNVAYGGALTQVGGRNIHTFTFGNTFTVVDGSGGPFDYIIVGGGGGGGGLGGGGAGRFQSFTGIALANGAYLITIGQRGLGAGGAASGTAGGSASFNGSTSEGGGGGAALQDIGGLEGDRNGGDGASGGGGGAGVPGFLAGTGGASSSGGASGNGSATGPSGPDPGGLAGGGGGGSGGAGTAGATTSATATGGNGGAGTSSSITGSAIIYAAGGGGGAGSTILNPGTGGSGAGGDAGYESPMTNGENGKTPGSGGGGGQGYAGPVGGHGARPIVIVSYPTPP